MKTDECKDRRLILRDFNRATHLSIISIFPHTLSFAILYHVFTNHSGCLSTTLGGTGLLISNNWKYSTHSPLRNHNSFESHAITVIASIKLLIVVIYRPNSSPLPRGAGRVAVLFHGGWHSTLSLWRFQHSSRQALCYRLSFTPSFI